MRELGIRAGENQNVVQMLEEALHRQSLLLVLDNFEHVVDAADLVGEMVQWSDDLRVLVTSRARLRVAGEQVFEVQPLPVEPEAGGARPRRRGGPVRAGRHGRRPALRAGRSTSRTSTAICRSVDGLPARDRDRRPATSGPCRRPCCAQRLAGRLEVGRGRGTRPPGPAADDPGDDRLEPPAARAGGTTAVRPARDLPRRRAARRRRGGLARTATCVDPLSVLVDHSLVRRTTGHQDEPRFGMLELVREHAAEPARTRRHEAVAARPRGVRRGVRRGPLRPSLDRRGRSMARRHHRDARRRCGRRTAGPAAGRPPTDRPHHGRAGRLLVPRGPPRRGPPLGRRDARAGGRARPERSRPGSGWRRGSWRSPGASPRPARTGSGRRSCSGSSARPGSWPTRSP